VQTGERRAYTRIHEGFSELKEAFLPILQKLALLKEPGNVLFSFIDNKNIIL